MSTIFAELAAAVGVSARPVGQRRWILLRTPRGPACIEIAWAIWWEDLGRGSSAAAGSEGSGQTLAPEGTPAPFPGRRAHGPRLDGRLGRGRHRPHPRRMTAPKWFTWAGPEAATPGDDNNITDVTWQGGQMALLSQSSARPSTATLLKLMRRGCANDVVQRYARWWKCPQCNERSARSNTIHNRAVRTYRPCTFNLMVGCDMEGCMGHQSHQNLTINIFDFATTCQVMAILGGCSSEECAEKFWLWWVVWARPPKTLMDNLNTYPDYSIIVIDAEDHRVRIVVRVKEWIGHRYDMYVSNTCSVVAK